MSRVLVLIKGLGRGGAEQVVVGTLRAFDRERDEFEVAYLLPWKDALTTEIDALGVPVHRLGDRHGRGWVRRLTRLTRSRRYDVIHSHSPYPACAARLLAPSDTRQVYTEHNLWDRYRTPTWAGNLATFPRNDRVLAVSDGVAASVRYPRVMSGVRMPPVERVYHGVDAERLRRAGRPDPEGLREEFGWDHGAPVVAVVANLKAHKGHEVMLAAAAALLRDRPDARFLFVGQGPLEDVIRAGIARRGLQEAVVMAGFRDDVPRLIASANVFALASVQEGLPIALLEAMTLEVPVVVTAVGGCPEVVRDGIDGCLVRTGDARQIATTLRGLLDDPGRRRRLGEAGRERARDFDLDAAARRIQDVYAEVSA